MKTVKVYKFIGYDFQRDAPVQSRRWATREFIECHKFGIAEETEIMVQENILDRFGLTPPTYNPNSVLKEGGFQTCVKRHF